MTRVWLRSHSDTRGLPSDFHTFRLLILPLDLDSRFKTHQSRMASCHFDFGGSNKRRDLQTVSVENAQSMIDCSEWIPRNNRATGVIC